MLVTEETFYKIVQDTWTSTLGFQLIVRLSGVFRGGNSPCALNFRARGWGSALALLPPLARLIASVIFQVEADKTGSDEILGRIK